MGSGPGQDQEFPCRRGRGRRRDGDPIGFQKWVEKNTNLEKLGHD